MRLIGALAGLALLLSAAEVRAQAAPPGQCGCGGSSLAFIAVGIITVSSAYAGTLVGFGVYDIVKAARDERASYGVAGAEVAMAAPAFIGFGITALADPSKNQAIWLPGLAVTGLLIGHGIYTFEAKPDVVSRVAVVPAVLEGKSGAAPGVLLAGRF